MVQSLAFTLLHLLHHFNFTLNIFMLEIITSKGNYIC